LPSRFFHASQDFFSNPISCSLSAASSVDSAIAVRLPKKGKISTKMLSETIGFMKAA
jgi:hypothetical protein